ncbi:hypothetical protein VTL71DRAFT_8237 [Oculimacula yallundae]|uniref:Uncharacterized protein n=1 Tax=Oculimacula yallundae TaxID=86028 RepID=A0ABR4CX14_9HELO
MFIKHRNLSNAIILTAHFIMVSDTRALDSVLQTDQASILQDLANGAADSAHVAEGDEAEDPGGADTQFDYLFEEDENEDDTYPIAGLETSVQEDLTNSAALLESLANYEPPSLAIESRAPPLLNDHDHFESLLQAAATAEVVEAAEGNSSQVRDNFALYDEFDAYEYYKRSFDPIPNDPIPIDTNNKRKRDEDYVPDDKSETTARSPSKRQKSIPVEVADEDAEQLALERELWGPEEEEHEDSISTPEQKVSPLRTVDARALGLQSATALFRRPSEASKKYTRAPMSKLFTSLELTAEQFLHLQSAAKAYMLDPNHPERSNCVGNRGRGDTDMVKLKLFACVKSFLEDEGWGPRCFTDDIEQGQVRKLKWPQKKNKIIQLVTPLMRRMVTNERQRLYTTKTRQEKRTKAPNTYQVRPSQGYLQPEVFQNGNITPIQYPVGNPKIDDYHYDLDLSFNTIRTGQENEYLDPEEPESSMPKEAGRNGPIINYLVNLVHDGRRVHPQVTLKPESCPGFASLVQHIHDLMTGINHAQQPDSIKVLGPTGLVNVSDEDSWRGAVDLIQQNEWLDGEVKCVVEVIDRVA